MFKKSILVSLSLVSFSSAHAMQACMKTSMDHGRIERKSCYSGPTAERKECVNKARADMRKDMDLCKSVHSDNAPDKAEKTVVRSFDLMKSLFNK